MQILPGAWNVPPGRAHQSGIIHGLLSCLLRPTTRPDGYRIPDLASLRQLTQWIQKLSVDTTYRSRKWKGILSRGLHQHTRTMASKSSGLCQTIYAAFILTICTRIVSSKAVSPSQPTEPLLGDDTIGHFMLTHTSKNFNDVSIAQTPDCTGLNYNVDVSTLNSSAWSCASNPILVPRRRRLPPRYPMFKTYSFSTTYDDGNGNGYNITYPTQLCSSSVIGDVLSPKGVVVKNATLQSVWTSLRTLSPNELHSYTVTLLQNAFNKFDAAMDPAICNPPDGGMRNILTRYTASQVSGKISLGVSAVVGTFGVAFGTLIVPISHPGITANLTKVEDTALIAASATMGTLYFWGLQSAHKAEITNILDAFIWTLVVSAGESILSLFQSVWKGVCFTSKVLWQVTENFLRQAQNGLVVVGNAGQAGVEIVPPNNPGQQPQPQNQPQVQVGNVCNRR